MVEIEVVFYAYEISGHLEKWTFDTICLESNVIPHFYLIWYNDHVGFIFTFQGHLEGKNKAAYENHPFLYVTIVDLYVLK